MEENQKEDEGSPQVTEENSHSLRIDVAHLKEAEARFHEIRTVNPASYAELESVFGKAYREQKSQSRKIEVHVLKLKAELDHIGNKMIFDEYPLFLEANPKVRDSADTRQRFVNNSPEVIKLKERIGMLEIANKICQDKVQDMENNCKVLRKQMDLIIKSGVPFQLYSHREN
jgi:hypothetical protein